MDRGTPEQQLQALSGSKVMSEQYAVYRSYITGPTSGHLLTLLGHPLPAMREAAAATVKCLVQDTDATPRNIVAGAGAVRQLLKLLRFSNPRRSSKPAPGALDAAVALLLVQHSPVAVQCSAASVLGMLAEWHTQSAHKSGSSSQRQVAIALIQTDIAAAGAIPPLVALLGQHSSAGVQE
ncbi:hypothetical protein FOA52_003894 [Chlamydomonas sp. UWO 241]|nr:hypothetical protein FOA52_003894 [Chlamydomonas sp. UWO 241]